MKWTNIYIYSKEKHHNNISWHRHIANIFVKMNCLSLFFNLLVTKHEWQTFKFKPCVTFSFTILHCTKLDIFFHKNPIIGWSSFHPIACGLLNLLSIIFIVHTFIYAKLLTPNIGMNQKPNFFTQKYDL